MASYESIKNKQNLLIRKAIEGSVFVAPASAQPIESLTGADSTLNSLPAGYEDVGFISEDGAQFAREVDQSDITSWGSVEPTRTDITSDYTDLSFAMQETKKTTIGLYTGADMSAVTPDAQSGEVSIEKPDRPSKRRYRVLTIGVDMTDNGDIYIARFLPQAEVTEYDDQSYQSGDDEPILWSVTMRGYFDSTLGYSERWMFGGPGWAAMLAEMGFESSSS